MSTPAPPAQADLTTTRATTQQTAAASSGDGGGFELLVLLPLVVGAVVLAVRARVFARNSIAGPPRLAGDESPGLLLLGFGGGFLIWIFSQVLFLAPATPTTVAPAPSTTPAATRATTTAAPSPAIPPARMAVVSILPALIAAGFVLSVNVALRRDGLWRIGLTTRQLGPGLKAGLTGSAIVIPLVFLVALLTELLWRLVHYEHPKEHDLLRLMGESQSPVVTVLLILSATVIAPVWEELLFRGHLQTLISYALTRLLDHPNRPGFDVVSPATAEALPYVANPSLFPTRAEPAPWIRWVAVLFTSLAFAIVHPAWTIPPIFFLSVCLGYAYERTGHLWATMLMHAAFNTTSTLIYLLLVH